MRSRVVRALAALACVAGLAACQSQGSESANERDARVIVFAAASLSEAFPDLSDTLVDADVAYNFDGSSGLLDQLAGGARADVLATADEATMTRAIDAGIVTEAHPYATNQLVLAVPAGNPAGITGLDSSLDGAALVICAADVPCGAATQRLAQARGVTLKPVSEEQRVSDVRGKVASGEADAGIIYATDARADTEHIDVVDIGEDAAGVNTYMIGVTADARHPQAARAFVAAVRSEVGQRLLRERYGFGAPPQ
ncbi:molybdate ABC transporter substrate-binding protein [Nanchangia anserum]|uniref:Molybdate ABC transporter substrate-binding protein n=1 Tax=Nanchangia anserum TaxID=2692125 RepID=A0A8I0KPM8_9ACTO|nr:molybdate ABC transporter substrate-binding protein [Nanchangia anserum]MBD3689060.1 molybdate ABC transporter substrate-binding protein [Nanchangia anserum]QOX81301.1 molybdate ABC transporter substrate-binding protein [Nanchangia anserum]